MRALSIVLLFLFPLPASAYLQGLCEQSPENPTLVLGLLAATAAGLPKLREKLRARRLRRETTTENVPE
jgi:XrtJ-associated TM-motif-TM protein